MSPTPCARPNGWQTSDWTEFDEYLLRLRVERARRRRQKLDSFLLSVLAVAFLFCSFLVGQARLHG